MENHLNYDSIDMILSDDNYLLYILLPPNKITEKIPPNFVTGRNAEGKMGINSLNQGDKVVVIAFRDLNTYEYYSPRQTQTDALLEASILNYSLNQNFNRIYVAREIKIWEGNHSE